ncbi:MAG: hypothetical protein BWY82_00929 [Verrucomicrobia bacterium ADurb.Bin474]|nr:MAG: hypothetical protein BWY82_00929 [Verrucomicrobia bacterium ADurb.Bin474]
MTCSSGEDTAEATTSAVAPGYTALTLTSGGRISGYWATGRVIIEIVPKRTITMERTDANTGRSMKNFENMI